jgi:hypothetical protein
MRCRCECRARPVPQPRADHSTHGPMSTPRVPSEYPASSEEDGPLRRLPFQVPYPRRRRPRFPAPLPSAHDRRAPASPLRVLSTPAARRGGTLSAPPVPCRAVVCAYSPSALREARCASTAQGPLPPPCAYPRSTGPCVSVASDLSSIRTCTMTPPRVPVCSALSDEDPMRPPRAVLV